MNVSLDYIIGFICYNTFAADTLKEIRNGLDAECIRICFYGLKSQEKFRTITKLQFRISRKCRYICYS